MAQRVLPDANVLFSRTLRDWLLLVEVHSGPYKVYWTEDIVTEVLYHLRRKHPTWSGARISSIRDKIVAAAEGGRIHDFAVDGSFPGDDPDDQHVDAAARAAEIDIVISGDLGFRAPGLADALPYEVYAPDEFFTLVDDSTPNVVREVAALQARFFVERSGEADLCGRLRSAGCPQFAERVRQRLLECDL